MSHAFGWDGRHRRRRQQSTRIPRRVLLACVAVLPLMKGAVHGTSRVALAGVVFALGAWLIGKRPALLLRAKGNPIVLVATLALGATVLQLLPVPVAFLRVLAPGAYTMRQVLGGHEWATLSLDAPATCMEIVALTTYLLGAVLAVALFRDSTRQRELLFSICAGGALTACVGFVGVLMDDASPRGLFGAAGTGFSATFVNPNHAAGYLGFASFIALGRAFNERRAWRAFLLLVGIACGAGTILSLSRGGILSYVGVFVLLSCTTFLRREEESHAGPLLGGLVVTTVLGAALAYSDVVHELWTLGNANGLDKPTLWRAVIPVVKDFPWLGMGRGVFVSASPHYLANPYLLATFTHLENEWLQILIDFGPWLGVVLIAIVVKAAWPLVAGMRASPTAAGLGAAVLYVAVQNMGDFSLQCPALAFPLVLLLACCSQPAAQPLENASTATLPVAVWCGLGAALAVVVGASAVGLSHSLEIDTQKVRAVALDRALEPRARDGLLRASMAWHPADYVMPLSAAENALTRGAAREAQRWAGIAMELAPDWAEPYRLAGRVALVQHRDDDAVTAYALACRLRPSATGSIADELLRTTGKPELVARLGNVAPQVRTQLATFLLRQAPAQSLALLARPTGGEAPGEVAQLRARAYMALGDAKAAATMARTAQTQAPKTALYYVLEADAVRAARDKDGALATLRRGLEQSGDVDALVPQIAISLMDMGRFAESRAYAQMLLERSGRSTATAHRLLGKAWQREGKTREALREYEICRNALSGELSVRLDIAALKEGAGDLRGAVQELEMAQQATARPADVDAALTRVRGKLRAQTDAALRETLQEVF